MRTLISICGLLAVFTGLALAENWTGKLLDASCYDQQKTAKGCDATSSSTQFILEASGKFYKLDAAGNAKAVEAMKSHAERSANPDHLRTGSVNAKVTGEKDGDDTLKVETVEIE